MYDFRYFFTGQLLTAYGAIVLFQIDEKDVFAFEAVTFYFPALRCQFIGVGKMLPYTFPMSYILPLQTLWLFLHLFCSFLVVPFYCNLL